ncbi:hypothetical protein CMUS01_15333, partial [Colletotrichum musicola]
GGDDEESDLDVKPPVFERAKADGNFVGRLARRSIDLTADKKEHYNDIQPDDWPALVHNGQDPSTKKRPSDSALVVVDLTGHNAPAIFVRNQNASLTDARAETTRPRAFFRLSHLPSEDDMSPSDQRARAGPQRVSTLAGVIRWLKANEDITEGLRPDIEDGVYNHPVVIISGDVRGDRLVVFMVTSLAGRTLDKACADRMYAASKARYLPIFPSPASNGIQLHLTKDSRPLSKDSYVNTENVFQVAPDALRPYSTRAFRRAEPRLEEESFQIMMNIAQLQPGFVAFMDKFKAGGVSIPAKLKSGGVSVPAKVPGVRPEETLAPLEDVVVTTITAPIDVPTPDAPTPDDEESHAPAPTEPPTPRPKDSPDDGVGVGPGQDEDKGVEGIEEVAVGDIHAHEILFVLAAFFVILGCVVGLCFRRNLEPSG